MIPVELGWGASFVVMNDSSSQVVCVFEAGGAVGIENREWGHLAELRGTPVVSLLLLREVFKAKPQSLGLDL